MAKSPMFCKFNSLNLLIETGNNASHAISIRKDPTCCEEKITEPSSEYIPFFMRIKELPQIQASKMSKIQLIACLDIFLGAKGREYNFLRSLFYYFH